MRSSPSVNPGRMLSSNPVRIERMLITVAVDQGRMQALEGV
jgi:hypothetical protein